MRRLMIIALGAGFAIGVGRLILWFARSEAQAHYELGKVRAELREIKAAEAHSREISRQRRAQWRAEKNAVSTEEKIEKEMKRALYLDPELLAEYNRLREEIEQELNEQ